MDNKDIQIDIRVSQLVGNISQFMNDLDLSELGYATIAHHVKRYVEIAIGKASKEDANLILLAIISNARIHRLNALISNTTNGRFGLLNFIIGTYTPTDQLEAKGTQAVKPEVLDGYNALLLLRQIIDRMKQDGSLYNTGVLTGALLNRHANNLEAVYTKLVGSDLIKGGE